MKKISITLIVIVMFMFNFTGCSNDNNTDNSSNQTNTSGEEIVGKLIGISNDEIKLSNNGKTTSYKISGDKVKDYYLGETIMLKGNGTDYDVSTYDKFNFDTRQTDEGDIITRTVGSVKEVGDKFITAVTELGDIEIMNPGNFNLPISSNVIFDYVSTKEGNKLISYYDESIKMDLKIKSISRDVDGKMLIVANDINDKEYEVTLNQDVLVNVNHSSLKVGDKIKVYPTSIGDETPPKINASMIIK